MEAFISDRVGRTIVLKLIQGEDLLESIEQLIEKEKIENAVVVSGIATFDRSRLHMIKDKAIPFRSISTKEQMFRWKSSA